MTIQPHQFQPFSIDPEQLARKSSLTEEQKIGALAQQFESLMLRQILAEARKPVVKSSLLPNSAVNGIYNDMVTQHLADGISSSGTLGLADNLKRELTRQLLTTKNDSAHPGATSVPK